MKRRSYDQSTHWETDTTTIAKAIDVSFYTTAPKTENKPIKAEKGNRFVVRRQHQIQTESIDQIATKLNANSSNGLMAG